MDRSPCPATARASRGRARSAGRRAGRAAEGFEGVLAPQDPLKRLDAGLSQCSGASEASGGIGGRR
ncbi:hypothetical protein, partial [Streptosporangium sandarakinum]|uniref:hypothetical protein n=1 Tax=Streptosporangium sandarakinum TaxID=1260955 RepID=UPI001C545D1C